MLGRTTFCGDGKTPATNGQTDTNTGQTKFIALYNDRCAQRGQISAIKDMVGEKEEGLMFKILFRWGSTEIVTILSPVIGQYD